MGAFEDLHDAIEHIEESTGDAKAWLRGLSPSDLSDVSLSAVSPQVADGLLNKVRQQHRDLFDPQTGEMIFPVKRAPNSPPGSPPPAPDRQDGEAAEAIRQAEADLAHQNSSTAQLDLQVITAVLNAHLTTVEGRDALNKLQDEIEAAVRTRTDLDTAAGARDLQRFLIGKLRDIRGVVDNASLDATSKAALASAWTSLYSASKSRGGDSPEPTEGSATNGSVAPGDAELTDPESDPLVEQLLADDPGLSAANAPTQSPPPPMPLIPAMTGLPSSGGGVVPNLGSMLGGGGMPAGLPLSGALQGGGKEPELALPAEAAIPSGELPTGDDGPSDPDSGEGSNDEEPAATAATPESAPPAGPTSVQLPTGETVIAPNPQIAGTIKAAASGTPIADAFRQQGINIPSPGTGVAHPVDPAQLSPGDIGMFTDRQALAVGNGKALLDGRIQPIASVSGPSFLGWEHPPTPGTTTSSARTETPTPTRPAVTAGMSQ